MSRSGAATQPVVITGPEDTARVFWWDAFEGVTTARYDGESWLDPVFVPIQIVEEVNNNPVVREPTKMPEILGDVNGDAHAVWLDVRDAETNRRPLLYSRLDANATTWSSPQTMAASALTWQMTSASDGVLHLVYIRTTHTTATPAGVYYRRSTNGGQSWTPDVPLYTTIYFRLLELTTAHLNIATGTPDNVVVAWENPEREVAEYVYSVDGGDSWTTPIQITESLDGLNAKHPRFVFWETGELLRLWKTETGSVSCVLYQQLSGDGGATWSSPERVMEDLTRCPTTMSLEPLPEGGILAQIQDERGDGMTLNVANVVTDDHDTANLRWSQPQVLNFTFQDEERETAVYLDDISVTLNESGALFVAGHSQRDEIWVLQNPQGASAKTLTSSSPWPAPTSVRETNTSIGLPAAAIDEQGQVHLLWREDDTSLRYTRRDEILAASGEELTWSTPTEVLGMSEHLPTDPTLVVADDYLHAVWSEGSDGMILYASSYIDDAHTSSGWSTPRTLSMGTSPTLLKSVNEKVLHLVFSIPWNERRGIYYTRSDDTGETWTEPTVVFDAAAMGWTMVDQPDVTVDAGGGLHVTWTRAAWQDEVVPQGVYYAYSDDGGKTWPVIATIAEGTYATPRVVSMPDRVHVVWCDPHNQGVYHRWSADNGASWSQVINVMGFENVAPVELLSDGVEHVYLLGLSKDEVGAWHLLQATWYKDDWEPVTGLGLGIDQEAQPGVSAALQPTLGELVVVFRSRAPSCSRSSIEQESQAQAEIRATIRSVSPITASLISSPITPTPTTAPTQESSQLPTATPRPQIDPARPPSPPRALTLGPLVLPLSAVGGILIAATLITLALFYQLVITRRR